MFAFLHALHKALRELHRRHRARLAELLVQGLAVASGKGRGMMFRRHPDIQAQRSQIVSPDRL